MSGFPSIEQNVALNTNAPAQTASAFLDAFNDSYKQSLAMKAELKKQKADEADKALVSEIRSAFESGDEAKATRLMALRAPADKALDYLANAPSKRAEVDDKLGQQLAPFAQNFLALSDPAQRSAYVRANRATLLAKGAAPEVVHALELDPTNPALEQTVRAYAEHGYTADQRTDNATNQQNADTQALGARYNNVGGTLIDLKGAGGPTPMFRAPSATQDGVDPGINPYGTGSQPVHYEGEPTTGTGGVTGGIVTADTIRGLETPNGRDTDANGNLWRSPKGAMGRMQVMEATARNPGYGVRPWDGKSRDDLARVGVEYLAAMRNEFSDDPAKVLAAYNAGPGRVKGLVARYGENWLAHAPAETQNYVQKGLSGGTGHAAPAGAQPVATTPAATDAPVFTVRQRAPSASASAQWEPYTNPSDPQGLYQRNSANGQVKKVSSAPKAGGAAGRPLQGNAAATYSKSVSNFEALHSLNSSFRDDYAGLGSSIENGIQKYVGGGTPGQSEFWAAQADIDNKIRNSQFGASLTEGEKAAFLAITVTPNMTPDKIRANLARREQVIESALAREQRAAIAGGYNKDQIKELSGGRVFRGGHLDGSDNHASGASLPQGAKQIGTLHGQPVYLLPNGKRVRLVAK